MTWWSQSEESSGTKVEIRSFDWRIFLVLLLLGVIALILRLGAFI